MRPVDPLTTIVWLVIAPGLDFLVVRAIIALVKIHTGAH